MSSSAGCNPLTGDPNQEELPAEVPSQIGLPASLTLQMGCECLEPLRTHCCERECGPHRPECWYQKLCPLLCLLIPSGSCEAGPKWASREASHNSGGPGCPPRAFFLLEKLQWGPFSVALCWPGGGRFGQCYHSSYPSNVSFSVSGPGGCFSLTSGFWDFHSSVLPMDSC